MERIKPGFKGDVDHIDGNGLNNQHSNLRIATRSQNLANRGSQENNTSGYKGVCWNKKLQKWIAKICIKGETIHIGCFIDKFEAARAYNIAAGRLFGEYAKLNEL